MQKLEALGGITRLAGKLPATSSGIASFRVYCTCEKVFRLGTVRANICASKAGGRGTVRFAADKPQFSSKLLECPALTARKEIAIAAAEQDFTVEQVGWRFALGTLILVGAYGAWPLIPLVVGADIDPGLKAGLSGLLGRHALLVEVHRRRRDGPPGLLFPEAHRLRPHSPQGPARERLRASTRANFRSGPDTSAGATVPP